MPYDQDGDYTPASGATDAFAGKVIASEDWNNIFEDLTTALTLIGKLYFSTPVTVTDATATVAATTSYVICNRSSQITLTLPSAATNTGRPIWVKNIDGTATVISASSNVVPRTTASAGTAICAAVDGSWVMMVSDGTNWVVMAGS